MTDDLSLIDVNDGYEFELRHPGTGAGIGLHLSLRSPLTPEVKALARTSIEKQRAAARRNKPFTVQQEESEALNINAACVIGVRFDEGANWKGKQPQYSEAFVRELLLRDWIVKQVSEELAIEANFFA